MRPFLTGLAAVVAAAALAVPAAAEEYELPNGLTVWLHQVSKAQHTAVVVVFDVGEGHDPAGQCGLAHLVEHCYVTAATKRQEARTVAAMRKAYPAGWNAQTGRDYTVIAAIVANDAAIAEVRAQGARMASLLITQADLDRERPRLLEELGNMFDHLPVLAARNHAHELVDPGAEHTRKGGLPAEAAKITVAQLQERWAKVYKPANARLMVSGAFDPKAMKLVIAGAFGEIPKGEAPGALRASRAPALGGHTDVAVSPKRPGLPAIATVAVRAPQPADAAFAPFLLSLSRMWVRQAAQKRGPGQVQVTYMPLDDPGAAYVWTPIGPQEKPGGAVKRINAFLQVALDEPVQAVNRMFAKRHFAHTLGTGTLYGAHKPNALYAVAFRHARLAQLGIDPGKLTRRLNAVITQTFQKMRAEVWAPEKRVSVAAILKP